MNAPSVISQDALPSLIDRAAGALLSAKDSAEVLEARDLASVVYDAAKKAARMAQAKGAHDAVIAAAHRAQADALVIEAEAKRRLADEYDAAQERGEVATPGGDRSKIPDENFAPATAEDLGLTRKQVHEARQIRDAEEAQPGIVKRTLDRAIADRREPTRAELMREIKAEQAEKAAAKREARDQKERALAARIREGVKALEGAKEYGVILADPPWRFEPYSRETGMDRAADNHYPTSGTDEICALRAPAAADAVLFLWATAPMLPDALRVMEAWGFAYKSHVVWAKDRIGTGYWARNKHELLLIGTRGNIPAPSPGTQPASLIEAAVSRHSAKPEVFHEMIEGLFPTIPRIEMFARSARPGWDVWGAEAPEQEDAA